MKTVNVRELTLIMLGTLLVSACATNPHEAKNIKTEMEKQKAISGDTSVGVKDGNLIVQKKVQMNEELRRIQNRVYGLEDRVYGNRKYGSKGLYGSLKQCRRKLVSREMGGDGKLMWTEPVDRVSDKEETFELGIDEKEKIVGVSEEFLKDRIKRFRKYRKTLQKREDEYEEKLEICDAKLAAAKHEVSKKSSN